MTKVTINLFGVKIREYETKEDFVPDVIGFLKEMKELERETKGAIKVRASVSVGKGEEP